MTTCSRLETTVTEAKGVRVNFAYRILNQRGELVLEAATFHACASLAGQAATPAARLIEKLAPAG